MSAIWGEVRVDRAVLLSISDRGGLPHVVVSQPVCESGAVAVKVGKAAGKAPFSEDGMAGSGVQVIWR